MNNPLTEVQVNEIAEIQRLLDEAYDHYFEMSDGYCKSNEGGISLSFTNYFDRRDGSTLQLKDIGIFSYVLGPERMHYFQSTAEALYTVRQWHADEMARTHDDHDERFLPVEKIMNMGETT